MQLSTFDAMSRSLLYPLLLFAMAAIIALSLLSGMAEIRPFLSLAANDRDKFVAIESGRTHPGLSYFSEGIVLDSCLSAMTSIYGRLQSIERRRTVASGCRDLAAKMTQKSPTYSYAWLIQARATQEIGASDEWSRYLLRSQMTGKMELWLAELRFQLFEDRLIQMPDQVRDNANEDVFLLLSTMRGRATVIRRFIQVPKSRERITRIAEQLPVDVKGRFLDELYGRLPAKKDTLAPDGGGT